MRIVFPLGQDGSPQLTKEQKDLEKNLMSAMEYLAEDDEELLFMHLIRVMNDVWII